MIKSFKRCQKLFTTNVFHVQHTVDRFETRLEQHPVTADWNSNSVWSHKWFNLRQSFMTDVVTPNNRYSIARMRYRYYAVIDIDI